MEFIEFVIISSLLLTFDMDNFYSNLSIKGNCHIPNDNQKTIILICFLIMSYYYMTIKNNTKFCRKMGIISGIFFLFFPCYVLTFLYLYSIKMLAGFIIVKMFNN